MSSHTPRVVIALSGGVDSSVCAALLKAEGYDCAAVFYELWSDEPKQGKGWENNCCSLEAYRDAQAVAKKLGIPLFRANISKEFKKMVVDYFIEEYRTGRTPNPCVVCNSELRFGLMLERAKKVFKADYLATGHYVVRDHVDSWHKDSLEKYRDTEHHIFRAHDANKDQSYFLHKLNQEQLGSVIFPLGGMQKEKVRELAKKHGLPTASKHDSQEVCFIPKGKTAEFVRSKIGAIPGVLVDGAGQKIADHEDIGSLTVGQRRGIGALGLHPHHVVAKDMEAGTVTVSANRVAEQQMLARVELEQVSLVGSPLIVGQQLQARYRPLQEPFNVRVRVLEPLCVDIMDEIALVAPGQSLVLMREDEILGGGVVSRADSYATLMIDKAHATRTQHTV